MDDLYRDYILEHYRRPHNFGVLDGATLSQEGAYPLFGDRITLQLRVRNGVIDGVGFTGRGCAISQASASLLTDEIKGKQVDAANALGTTEVLDMLGIEISPARMKCALLSLETLHGALESGAKSGADPAPAKAAQA
jgi:nitrogen fixation NifU-like protein